MNKSDLDILKRCLWYSQLLMIESNHIYKAWYGEEPPLTLREDLIDYLNTHERNNIIEFSFHLKTSLRKR